MKVRSFNLVNPRLLETILNVQRLTKGLPSSVYRVESPIDKGTLDIFVWSQKKGNVYIFKLKLRANVRSVPRSIFSLNDMVMSDTRLILLFLRVPLFFGHSPLCFGHVQLCFGHVLLCFGHVPFVLDMYCCVLDMYHCVLDMYCCVLDMYHCVLNMYRLFWTWTVVFWTCHNTIQMEGNLKVFLQSLSEWKPRSTKTKLDIWINWAPEQLSWKLMWWILIFPIAWL